MIATLLGTAVEVTLLVVMAGMPLLGYRLGIEVGRDRERRAQARRKRSSQTPCAGGQIVVRWPHGHEEPSRTQLAR